MFCGKPRKENYVSFNLVHSCWADRRGYCQIGHARAYDDFLDDRARHHRVDHRRCCHPHVCASDKSTVSSGRPHFFHVGRDPDPLYLLQAKDSLPPSWIFVADKIVASRPALTETSRIANTGKDRGKSRLRHLT